MFVNITGKSAVVTRSNGARTVFGWPWPGRSKEERAKKRKMIEEDFKKGYFQEIKEFRQNRGKRFEAGSDLEPRDRAVKFPSISGATISGNLLNVPLDQASLVLVSMKQMGMHMCKQYLEPLEKEEGELANRLSLVEISLLESQLYSVLLRSTIERNLLKSIPSSRHDTFMVYCGKAASELRSCLDIHNSLLGYAYLLDREGLIRWRAHAQPTERELQRMIKCSTEL